MFKPKFEITSEINNRIAEIERIREVVSKSKILPQQEVVLRMRAKVDAVHSSTSIEGNVLNKREIEKVLAGERVRASEKTITEALNYKKAIDWMEKRLSEFKRIGIKDTLNFHRLLMRNLLANEKVGVFRKGPVFIVDVMKEKDVVKYIGPKSERIEELVKELLTWLKEEGERLHPVLTAGILHYQFVSIHPFSDGNGRATRLLTTMYLWFKKYDFRKTLALDTYYWQNRIGYYEALSRAKTYDGREGVNITPWLDFFTKGFLETVKDLEKEITAVSLSNGSGQIVRLSNDELLIVDFTKQMSRVDLSDVLQILDISERTAQRRLKGLVDKKILKKHGKGKNVYYQFIDRYN
ncbi:MAG: Fic family protein [Patescibacteria group bacterium]